MKSLSTNLVLTLFTSLWIKHVWQNYITIVLHSGSDLCNCEKLEENYANTAAITVATVEETTATATLVQATIVAYRNLKQCALHYT